VNPLFIDSESFLGGLQSRGFSCIGFSMYKIFVLIYVFDCIILLIG
jgi:hypothetical protein